MHFLHDFSKNHKETKMNSNNIAIVIGPNLLWPKVERYNLCICISIPSIIRFLNSATGLVGDTAFHTRTAECFIKFPEYFFGKPPVINLPEKPVKFTAKVPPVPPSKPSTLSLGDSDSISNVNVDDDESVDFDETSRPLSINSEDSVNGKGYTSMYLHGLHVLGRWVLCTW